MVFVFATVLMQSEGHGYYGCYRFSVASRCMVIVVATSLVQREGAWFNVVATGLVQPDGA